MIAKKKAAFFTSHIVFWPFSISIKDNKTRNKDKTFLNIFQRENAKSQTHVKPTHPRKGNRK